MGVKNITIDLYVCIYMFVCIKMLIRMFVKKDKKVKLSKNNKVRIKKLIRA